MPAAWTMCVQPAASSVSRVEVEDVALDEAEVRVVARGRCPESASRWRLSTATTSFASTSLRRERRPDEAGAAGDQDPLARQGHPRIVDAPDGGIGGRGCRRPRPFAHVRATPRRPLLSQPAMSQPVTLGPPTSSPRLKA